MFVLLQKMTGKNGNVRFLFYLNHLNYRLTPLPHLNHHPLADFGETAIHYGRLSNFCNTGGFMDMTADQHIEQY